MLYYKWHQLLISGESVSVEQAKEIILLTDPFFIADGSGNDHRWIAEKNRILGIDSISFDSIMRETDADKRNYLWDLRTAYAKHLGHIQTYFINCRWASSSYIFGPYGVVSPNGTIFHEKNIGSYPSTEDVFSDFSVLVERFPFLNMSSVAMSEEYSSNDENTFPLVGFKINNGSVLQVENKDELTELYAKIMSDHAKIVTQPRKYIFSGASEHGLPEEWFEEYAIQTKRAMILAENELGEYKCEK